jgi:transcriptional regulator with XRE-family HTH domain
MTNKSDQSAFLDEIAAALGVKPRSLSKRLGVDRSQVARWRKNGFHPSTERLIRALMESIDAMAYMAIGPESRNEIRENRQEEKRKKDFYEQRERTLKSWETNKPEIKVDDWKSALHGTIEMFKGKPTKQPPVDTGKGEGDALKEAAAAMITSMTEKPPQQKTAVEPVVDAEQPVDAEDLGVINGPIRDALPKEKEKPQEISIEADKPRKKKRKTP